MADKKDGNSGTPVFSNIMSRVSSSLGSANESVKSGVSNVSQTVGSTVSKGASVVQEVTTAYGLIILVTVVVAIILFIIAYYLYRYMSTRLVRKLSYEIEGTATPLKTNKLNKLTATNSLPSADNGRRFTYSFWIYIYDLSKFTQSDSLRHIVSIGGTDSNLGAGSTPSVYLDGMKNKIYFRFKKSRTDTSSFKERIVNIQQLTRENFNGAAPNSQSSPNLYNAYNDIKNIVGSIEDTPSGTNDNTPFTFDDAIKLDLSTRGVIIDYVPLQRWVHVAVVYNETVNTGLITVYLDAEVVKTVNSDTYYTLSTSADSKMIRVNLTDIDPDPAGLIYIGGDDATGNILGFSGLFSKLRVTNYDLNAREIKDIYIKGPVNNLAGRFGLPPYGIRSPIYRIGGDQNVDDL